MKTKAKRTIDYLRISVTDRCNLRCVYCTPVNGVPHFAKEDILNFDEIVQLVKIFASLGVRFLRITGGEPLIRRELSKVISMLNEIKGIEEISLTTNGLLLEHYARELKAAGLKRVNVSLDTLKSERFQRLARGGSLEKVLSGIKRALDVGLKPLKLNVVLMRGMNDDEIPDFVRFSKDTGVWVRFIEYMRISPLWNSDHYFPIEEAKKICYDNFELTKLDTQGPGPAEYFRVDGMGVVGFIKTKLENCMDCRRLRLTSVGELKLCLYQTRGIDLKDLLRKGKHDEIKKILNSWIKHKSKITYLQWKDSRAFMCQIGG